MGNRNGRNRFTKPVDLIGQVKLKCRECGKFKDLTRYERAPTAFLGVRRVCKDCRLDQMAEAKTRNNIDSVILAPLPESDFDTEYTRFTRGEKTDKHVIEYRHDGDSLIAEGNDAFAMIIRRALFLVEKERKEQTKC